MIKIKFSSTISNLLTGLAFLMPIFFLPLTNDLYDINKRFLFFVVTLVSLLVLATQVFIKKELRLTRTPWTIPIALFGISTLASILIVSPDKVEALMGTGGAYLAFTLLYFSATTLIRKNFTERLLIALSTAGVIVTVSSILDRVGISITQILSHFFGLVIPAGTGFFITGSPLFSAFFLGLVAILLIVRLVQSKGRKNGPAYILLTLVCALGIGANVLNLLPSSTNHPQFLSFLDSWSIATDVVKTPVNAVLGVGTDSYATAFSIFKPMSINQTPLWFVRYNDARDILLELLVTQGVFGLIAWTLILITTIRLIKTAKGDQLILAVGTLLIEVLFIFFPPNFLFMGLLCLFLIAWSASLKERGILVHEQLFSLFAFSNLRHGENGQASKVQTVVSRLVGTIMVLAIIVGFYAVGRAYAGEFIFNQSLIAANKGDARATYDNAVKAIDINPYMESYHRAFAITNLSLAQVISQNKSVSDQDKQNIITLIQQAIQQAKIATTLDQLNTANWDTLTTVYQNLIGTATGADQWTVASFVEQAKTDPSNPQLRFNLGTVYRQIGNDDLAIKLFEQAAQLKPDYANPYFNLADIYKKRGDKQNEFTMLQATLTLIKPEQSGYQDVKSRYDQLQTELAAPAPKTSATPAPVATPVATPKPSPTPKAARNATTSATLGLPADAGLPQSGSVPALP